MPSAAPFPHHLRSIPWTEQFDTDNAAEASCQYSRAQTFVAGRSGILDQVSLRFSSPGPRELWVEIQSVSGAIPTGTVLGSGTYFTLEPTLSNNWTDVPLQFPAQVVEGQPYALVIHPICNPWPFALTLGPDGYAAGSAWCFIDGAWISSSGDVAFRTWTS